MTRCVRRLSTTGLLAFAALAAGGCGYLRDRGNDAMDVADVGFTFSERPQFAAYYDFIPVAPIGYGDVEGWFAGIGGGQICLWAPHTERSYGLILWGQEEVNFGTPKADLDAMTEERRNEALLFQRTGLIGMIQGPFPGPAYLISCPHYVHLGWIGGVASPRYLEMLDFALGWTTFDICGDDGVPRGAAPSEESAIPPTATDETPGEAMKTPISHIK